MEAAFQASTGLLSFPYLSREGTAFHLHLIRDQLVSVEVLPHRKVVEEKKGKKRNDEMKFVAPNLDVLILQDKGAGGTGRQMCSSTESLLIAVLLNPLPPPPPSSTSPTSPSSFSVRS